MIVSSRASGWLAWSVAGFLTFTVQKRREQHRGGFSFLGKEEEELLRFAGDQHGWDGWERSWSVLISQTAGLS